MPSIPGRLDRRELARELANAVAGEVRFGVQDRMLYATDASLYQVEPVGVVIPRDVEDAVAAMRFCAARKLPILPRGGGTSLAGQCTNDAVVIDLSPNCRAVLGSDAAARRVRVEPGITIDDLNDTLTRAGGELEKLFFAPDPATSRHATIGGCIGNNAAGARSVRYGRTSESVVGLDAWIPSVDGIVRLEAGAAGRDPRVASLTRRVLEIVLADASEIRERFPKTVRRNAGYALDMVLNSVWPAAVREPPRPDQIDAAMLDRVNLAHLLCGSEGTLGFTTGAELRLHDKPGAKGLAVLGFESLDGSIEAVSPILTTGPSAVELLDDTVIDLAKANTEYRRYVEIMPRPVAGELRAVLYVEYFGRDAAEIAAKFEALRHVCPGVAVSMHTDAGAMLNAWKLRKAGEPLLHGIPGARKPITFVEDNAVPVEHLVEFVKEFRAIVAKHGTRAAYYAHASVGVLHVRPLIDIHDAEDRSRMRSIAIEVADLAKSLGGVMSGEHGDGRIRGPLLERFFGAELMRAFREVKATFDPGNLLNPGNIVDLDGTRPRPIASMTQNLRVEPMVGSRPRPVHVGNVETFFDYDDQSGFDHAVEQCNGAGVCRKKQGGTMCPSYMATLDERHSTRGRGNALRLAITGQLPSEAKDGEESGGGDGRPAWDDAGTIETLNLCLSCKACKTECPSNVDIARLKAEYTGQRYRENGAPLQARVFGQIRALNRAGAVTPGFSNWIAQRPAIRGIINRLLGLHPRRSLPLLSRSLAARWRERTGGEGAASRQAAAGARTDRPRVVLFGDCFTMFNESAIGMATKVVYEAFGYDVALADAGCCGRAKMSLGLLTEAIDEVDATLARLRPLIEDPGVVAILVAEPSCLSAFKDDWLRLKVRTPIEIRRRLAAKSHLPEEFLDAAWANHPRRPSFVNGSAVTLHGHCHQKALWGAETSSSMLRRLGPIEVLDSGCCGMAGAFGYTADRYDLSMKIGELTLFPAVRRAAEREVCAPGTSCRHQIHDGTGRRAKHPIEVIAERLVQPPADDRRASS